MTAEPYFSVTRPSNEVVAENIIRQRRRVSKSYDARFDMLEGGEYTVDMPATQLPSTTADPKTLDIAGSA